MHRDKHRQNDDDERGDQPANGAPERPPWIEVGVRAQRVAQLAAQEEVAGEQEEHVHAAGYAADEDVEEHDERNCVSAKAVDVHAVGRGARAGVRARRLLRLPRRL